MEVLVGPTYDMQVSSAAAAAAAAASSSSSTPSCVRDRTTGVPAAPTPVPAQAQDKVVSSSCLFLNDDDEEVEGGDRKIWDKFNSSHGSDDSPEISSSIGVPSDSEDENDEVSSYEGEELHRTNFSMDLFGDNLPIKRGLSSHYSGKSKSFSNLSEANTAKDLEKEENPLNKRRRVLIASKLWSRNSFYS